MAPPNEPNITGSGAIPTPSTSGKGRLAKMTQEATALSGALAGIAKSLTDIAIKGSAASAALKGLKGGGATGGVTTPVTPGSHNHPTMNYSSPGSSTGSNTRYALAPSASGAGGAGGLSPMEYLQAESPGMAKGVGAFSAVMSVVGAGVSSMDERIARGYAYSSSADKMSVMYQQITGMSNSGVRNAYRQPLTNYRLGATGINSLMGMQASTGISALGQASTVEGMNALSGYSLGAEGVTNMVTNLGSAQTANRMFMTTGMSLYKPGGGQRSGTEVIQNLARASGLMGLKNMEGALQQGSNIRARLADMGADSQMQDLVIQYAMANKQFGAKGGKGMYDPSNKGQRKMMGIEDNFATQIEETTRVKVNREEDFYGRQQDNFANLEKATQSLEKMFGKLEDKLSGIIGKGIDTKPKRNMLSSVGKVAGIGLTIAGAATLNPGLIAAGVGITAASDAIGDPGTGRNLPTMGDPPPSDKRETVAKLHPNMRQRVEQMVAASGGRVSIGNGYRSPAEQEAMFRSRYRKTSSPTDSNGKKNWEWAGSYWEHVSGAQAAPPGRSMHEIGLAADLSGDMAWVQANAGRFGLKHFAGMGEPWHVQPAEFPNGRSEYEKQGRPWGGAPMSSASGPAGGEHGGSTSGGNTTNSGITTASLSGMSMSDALATFRAAGTLGSTGLSGGTGSPRRRRGVGTATSTSGAFTGAFTNGGMARSGVDIQQWSTDFLNRVGAPVTAANLEAMSAWIASEGTRAAYNPLAVKSSPKDPADVALGQWSKFNNEGSGVKNFANYEQGMRMNVFHMQNYGKRVINALQNSSNDPYAVAEAVNKMYASWGGNAVMSSVLKSRKIPQASSDQTGDAVAMGSARSGGSATFQGGATFNISPVININGSANPHVDAQVIAQEVTMIIEREMRMRSMRSA